MTSCNVYSLKWLQACLVMGLLSLMLPAQAATEAALVLFSHGNVVLTNNSGSYPLEKGASVASGDTVITGEDGRIQMRFSDGGLVSLMPNSRFAVEEYSQPTASSEGSASVNLLKGGMRALSGSIGKNQPDNYKLKTNVATLGIRGTQFVVVMDADVMRVHVGEGRVALFNEFGDLLVDSGQHAEVMPGQAPALSLTAPMFVSSAKVDIRESEDKRKESSQSPELSDSPKEIVRTLEPGVAQGATAGTILDENGDELNIGNVIEVEPDIPTEISPYTSDSLATAFVIGGPGLYSLDPTEMPDSDEKQGSISFGPDSFHLIKDTPDAQGTVIPNSNMINNATKVGDLYWYEMNQVVEAYDPTDPSIFRAVVWGETATNLPLTGQLTYSLAPNGASPVRVGWGEESLERFDLTIDILPSNKANVDVGLVIAGGVVPDFYGEAQNVDLITDISSGSSGAEDLQIGAFNFGAKRITDPTYNDSSCGIDCLQVSGFLSGEEGSQAGVVYNYQTHDGDLTGSAILNKVP